MVYARFIVKAFFKSQRDHLYQVLIALRVFGQKDEMVLVTVELRVLVEAGARSHVDLASDDRLYTDLFGLFVKTDRAERDPVVGYRHGSHTKLFRLSHELVYPAGSVKKTVFCMYM